jgi:hypothetical protein
MTIIGYVFTPLLFKDETLFKDKKYNKVMESINKYNNGKIYKIVDNTNNNIYIGSTCDKTLARRLSGHRNCYKSYLKGTDASSFVTSFDILKNGDYSIILLENYQCKNKEELTARERYYIDSNICINKYRPTRTNKEYYEDNKEHIKEYKKKYYKDNKDKILEKNKETHKCECGGKYTIYHKCRHLKTNRHLKYCESIKTETN